MTDTHQRDGLKLTGRFFLWGWVMLVVVLLSAAPSGGQPRSRFVGSAFDPASVSVVLRPSKAKSVSTSAPLQKRKALGADSGGTVIAIIEPATFRTAPMPDKATPRGVQPAVPERRLVWPAHGPRAPPAG